MAMWGTYYLGWRFPVAKDEELVAGKIYEGVFTTPIDIPDNLELPLIRELLKLKLREPTARTTFVYVKRRTVIVQWYQTSASPISAGAVIAILVGLALLVILAGLTLLVLSRVESILTMLGTPATLMITGMGFILLLILLVAIVLPAIRRRRT